MKITRRQLRRLIKEEMLGVRDAVKKQTISEGIMVSLKPITQLNRPEESREEMWMRIAGITEEVDKEKWPNAADRQVAVDKVTDAIASATGLTSDGAVVRIIKDKLENEPDTILARLVDLAEVPAKLKKWYKDNVDPDTKGN